MGFVIFYLMRLEPFTAYHKALQSGRFDHADRLFHSLARTYHSCTHSSSDVKELVPELFYLPDALLNRNNHPLGTRQDGQQVGDVVLPPWANDAPDFIAKHRAALESEHVSAHLHEWIDLIFGCKQRGKEAVDNLNVFFYLTYEVDLRGRSPAEVSALKAQINNFGQMPQQLLLTPHPQRRARPPPPSLLTQRRENQMVGPCAMMHFEAVPITLLALDEAVVMFDAGRRTVVHRVEGHRKGEAFKLSATGSIIGDEAKASRLTAFAPNLPLARAVTLAGADVRGRDALLVSGGHWDNSLCISLAHGGGGTRHRLCHHTDVVTSVAVSSCGRWLLSGSLDSTALLWSLGEAGLHSTLNAAASSGAQHHAAAARFTPAHVLRGHAAAVLCVGLSSVLRLAASGSRDGTTALYTLRDGKRVRKLREPSGAEIEQLLLCDSGGYVVAVAAAGSRMHLFTLNGLLAWSWEAEGAGCSAVRLSLNGDVLLCGFDDGSLCAWRLHDRQPLCHFTSAPAPITCLAISPLDGCLVVGTSRAELLIYPALWTTDYSADEADAIAAGPFFRAASAPEEVAAAVPWGM